MQSALKPSIKRVKSTWERGLTGQRYERKGGHYDRGRGIEPVGQNVLDVWNEEETEYRRIFKILAGVALNNRQQNAVYRMHVRRLS